jgi:glyceraldehyde 3-phosphate dehydrogenase
MKKNDTAPISIAINGAGRIGRAVFRAYFEHRSRFPHCRLVAMNDPHDFSTLRHLLRYDSVHGKAPFDIQLSREPDALLVNGESVRLYASRDPAMLPWASHSIDCVLECTGRFKDRAGLTQHLHAGAQRVILSAPAKDALDSTIVLGANDADLEGSHQLISIGSCTTNALAPILRIAQQFQPVERCFFTTVHAYTKDQSLVDSHHSDLRRARSAQMSIIPTRTGAAKTLAQVLPSLSGKVEGYALRVPTANVSLIDAVIEFPKSVSLQSFCDYLKDAVKSSPYVSVTDEPLVSCDFNQDVHSAVIDLSQTQVNGHSVRVVAWYDNEWAYALRMLDMANLLAEQTRLQSRREEESFAHE